MHRREIYAIGANEGPKSCAWGATEVPIDWVAQLFGTYELADPSMSLEEAGGFAVLVELAGAITTADALYRTEDDAAFAAIGGAPDHPPPADVDALVRGRVDELRAIGAEDPPRGGGRRD